MANKNFSVGADSTVIQIQPNSTNNGVGLFTGLTNYLGSTFVTRSLMLFNLDWTGVASVTSAELHIRTGANWIGAAPGVIFQRITSGWTEPGVTWNTQPSTTSTNQVTVSPTNFNAANTWYVASITNLVKQWAPANIPGGGAQTNYGIMLFSTNEASTAAATNFSDRETAYDAYIVLTYGSNTAPNAPQLNSPGADEVVASQTPTVNFYPIDPDGDSHTEYQYQVSLNDFTDLTEDAVIAGAFPNGVVVNRPIATTLTRGVDYFWRVRTKDAVLYGPWASAKHFKIGVLPVGTVTTPTAGHTSELWYTAGTSTNPKIRARWSFSCGDGHAQTHYKVKLYADSAGSPGANVYDSGWVAGAGLVHDTTYAAVNGTKYHVSVQVRCSITLESAESTKNITRVRWARASYFFDSGSTPVTLNVDHTEAKAANQELVLEYTATGSTTEPTTWYQNVASAGLNRYFWHRVTMWGWSSATPSSPSLLSLTWFYSPNALVLDNWIVGSSWKVDTSQKVFGTQSIRSIATGSSELCYQLCQVEPNRDVILSGRIKTSGNPEARLLIYSSDGLTELASVTAPTVTTDWARYTTPSINTGSETSLYVLCQTSGTAGTTAWFDVLKFEQSTVATPWAPGFISGAVTVDSGGLGVDAYKGGVLRLRGSAGGTGDTVTLGSHGLVLGDTGWSAGTTFPATPVTGEIRYRSDLGIEFRYDGTRWLSSTLYHLPLGISDAVMPFGATVTGHRTQVPLAGVNDLWLEKFQATFYVVGGTALSGSHKWVAVLTNNPAGTGLGTINIDSGASSTWRNSGQVAIGALVGTTNFGFDVTATKTGTPGNLYLLPTITYRIVAT